MAIPVEAGCGVPCSSASMQGVPMQNEHVPWRHHYLLCHLAWHTFVQVLQELIILPGLDSLLILGLETLHQIVGARNNPEAECFKGDDDDQCVVGAGGVVRVQDLHTSRT